MSTYRTLKPIAMSVDNVVHHYRAGVLVDLDDDRDNVEALVAKGRVELVHASASVKSAEVVEETEGEKTLEQRTVPELQALAKSKGASADSVKNLGKAKLIEAIERLTHVADD